VQDSELVETSGALDGPGRCLDAPAMSDLLELLVEARLDAGGVQGSAVVESALRLESAGPSERWDVDLTVPRITWSEGTSVIFGGPCQLLGSWVEGDGFLWGFENPSVDAAGTRVVRAQLEAMPDVAPLLATRKHALTREEAADLCRWLAVRAGYTGCFVAPQGVATVFLAVTLRGPEALGQARDGWCCACGSTRAQVQTLVAGPRGVMFCDRCGRDLADVAASHEGEPEPAVPGESLAPALRLCVLCGQPKGGLILGPHAGVCRACAAILGNIFAPPAG
jgi:hypothetical protein